MPSTKLTAIAALAGSVALASQCAAFVPAPARPLSSPCTNSGGTTALQAKGRRSKDLVGVGSGNASAGKGVKGLGGDAPTATSAAGKTANWVPVAGLKSMKELPQEENKVRDDCLVSRHCIILKIDFRRLISTLSSFAFAKPS